MTDAPPATPNLIEALQTEIERVTRKHERWLGYGVPGISTAMMQFDIDIAKAALASLDIVRMMTALEVLKGYSDDD